MRKSASDQLWQLKITLNGIQPPIWRRIQVAKCTLAELHDHIQLAVGWQNAHLYQFTINGVLYSDPRFSDEVYPEIRDARVVKLNKFFNDGDKPYSFLYEFDPEAFDAVAVTKRMQRGFPKPRPEDYI